MKQMNMVRRPSTANFMPALLVSATLLLRAYSAAQAGSAAGNSANAGVLPPASSPYGQTCGEWSAQWWQWALSIPADRNPLLDPTGQDAAIGQTGNVWFLAGTAGGTAERAVTVPAGKALFFPILNTVYVSCCGDPPWDQPYTDATTTPPTPYPTFEAYIRFTLKSQLDAVVGLACEIDGRAVQDIAAARCQSPSFMVQLPEGNLFGIDPGTYGPSAADGYYLMLAPLRPGTHTLHFTGGFTDGSFSLDVTYHLAVAEPGVR